MAVLAHVKSSLLCKFHVLVFGSFHNGIAVHLDFVGNTYMQ